MKKVNKYIIVSAALAVLIVTFAVLLILYDKRVFDISFIKRPDETTAAETSAPETSAPDTDTDTEPADTNGENTEPDDTSGDDTEVPKSVFDELHEKYKAVSGETLNPTEKTYGEGTALYRLDGLSLPSVNYTGVTMTRTRYITSNDKTINGKRAFSEYKSFEYRKGVDVYMGMIVVSEEGSNNLTFYNGKGEQLYRYEGEEELVFAYERDSGDRPLFILGEQYYYIDTETHELAESDFDIRDSRGLNYNYPTTLGKSEGQYLSFRRGDSYGITDTDGNVRRNAIYEQGYNYSEGLGMVVYRGTTYYFDEDMKIVIDGERRDIYPVEKRDEGGIGSIYFDGGYVLARIIKLHPLYEVNPERYNVAEEDAEVLIDTKGNVFELPDGCAVKAYSDQRVLVSKNNKYGFYAVKGAWIADTVYDFATPYYEGLAVVGTYSAKGVIDMDGNFVIPRSYSVISVCSGGIFVCWSAQTGYDIYVKTEI